MMHYAPFNQGLESVNIRQPYISYIAQCMYSSISYVHPKFGLSYASIICYIHDVSITRQLFQ